MRKCHYAGQTNNKQVKIELLSQWMLEAEFRNWEMTNNYIMLCRGWLAFGEAKKINTFTEHIFTNFQDKTLHSKLYCSYGLISRTLVQIGLCLIVHDAG